MDETGNHHSLQTNARTENQTLHVLTHKLELTMRTHGQREGNIAHWGLSVGRGVTRGRIALVEIPNVDYGLVGAANHHGLCTYVTNLHVLHMYPRI